MRSENTYREGRNPLVPTARSAILDMQDEVLLWRIAQLARAGYNSECAVELAMADNVDLHVATDLLRRGCPFETATRILL